MSGHPDSAVGATAEVAVDWTRCFAYDALVAEEVAHYSGIEVTAELREGGVAAAPAWERWYRYLAARWGTDFLSEVIAGAAAVQRPRLLSLGCGYGGIELDCARRLAADGGGEILALDLNPALFAAARETAAREHLPVVFAAADLNFVALPEGAFDVVFAHASLHHLLNLEHLFAAVHQSLAPHGRFVVLDVIGKAQVLFWRQNLELAAALVAELPERLRAGLRPVPEVLFPSYLEGASLPGMEGLRQEEIPEQIVRWFRPLSERRYNSFVRLLCTHPVLGSAFDTTRPDDCEILDQLFARDLEEIASGRLRPTEMFAVYEKLPDAHCPVAAAGGGGPRRLVSVVVAAHLAAPAVLEACLASVRAQTHRDLEVLVIGAAEPSLPAGANGRGLAIRRVEGRALPSDGLDLGPALAAARGEYVALLDARDTWFPTKLAAQLALLDERPQAGLTYGQALVVDGRGRRTRRALGRDVVGEGPAVDGVGPGAERVPRSTAVLRTECCRRLLAGGGDQGLTSDALCEGVARRWQAVFAPQQLGMLRAPEPAVCSATVAELPPGAPAAADPAAMRYRQERIAHWEELARRRQRTGGPAAAYHRRLARIYRFCIPPDARVLELGCGRGDLLAALAPATGVGIDFSPEMVRHARQRHPHLRFEVMDAHEAGQLGETFDAIVLSDLVNDVWDVQGLLAGLAPLTHRGTRLVLNVYSRLWEVPLLLAQRLGLAQPLRSQNWLTVDDLDNLLRLAGFVTVRHWSEVLLPLPVPALGPLCNRLLVRLWGFRHLALANFLVARPAPRPLPREPRVSVVVPARNEAGNVPAIFDRVPQMGAGTELVFVEGHSSDDTWGAIEREISARPGVRARLLRQPGVGKGDAVRAGFAASEGEVLMILDADLTVPPEDLPRFYEVLHSGSGELVNGVRLVYPMERQAMRLANLAGNKLFSLAFSWLLGQPIKDTLCGTKALLASDWARLVAGRGWFGDFDPFGDFDLLFGAARLNLDIVELPIRYRERTYGTTNIRRWRHGWLLLMMCAVAARRLKVV